MMPTNHRALRLIIQASTFALTTAVAGMATAQDQPSAQKPRVAQPAKRRTVAASPKDAPTPRRAAGKTTRDRRDDAMFGGDDAAPPVGPEDVPRAADEDDTPWKTDDALFGDPESFEDLDTASPPETTEAEHRGSTRPPPRAVAPASPPAAGGWRVTPIASPEVLEWDGGEVPLGYEPGTRVRKGLIIGGAVTFGVSWLAAAGYGVHLANERDAGAWRRDDGETPDEAVLFIPVAGPFIALGTLEPGRGPAAALIADGIAQVGGLAMLAAGIFAKETVLVKSDAAEVQLAPTVGPTGSGVALLGSF